LLTLNRIRRDILTVLWSSHPRGMKIGKISSHLGINVNNVRMIMYRMRDDVNPCIFNVGRWYYLTTQGIDVLHIRSNRYGTTAEKWVSLVRQGMDSQGHETAIQRAKTPCCIEVREPNIPPIEEWIDSKREVERWGV
jgi:predicted ArsR family transcriptional regulator